MKKLIIVCEDRLRKYGDFLAQLISSKDDKDDENGEVTVGIKDGSTAAQVWSEKEYLSNQAQISSEQYILFIGNSKTLKDKRMFFINKFSEYGMNYGWLGKQAALFVENTVSLEEYGDFFKFAQGYQPNIKALFETTSEPMALPDGSNEIIETEIVSEEQAESEDENKKGLLSVKLIKSAVSSVAHNSSNTLKRIGKNANKSFNNKKLEDQQYSCLVFLFYLKGLSFFLGLSEE